MVLRSDVWLHGGKKLFDGKYELMEDHLTLKGRFVNHDAESIVQLTRWKH